MESCMSCAVGVPGGCCPMICPTGVRCICIFANGSKLAFGNRSMLHCDERFVLALGASLNPVLPLSTVNPSKPVRCVAMRVATMGEKKLNGKLGLWRTGRSTEYLFLLSVPQGL